jgi:DMSO/TMAO reductase YedYZ molybdopterin-dependent catalytic subunit
METHPSGLGRGEVGHGRRYFLRGLAAASVTMGAALSGVGSVLAQGDADSLLAGRPLVRYPEKTDLILLTSRPPQLETPMKYFETAITPNEAFYVRYHTNPPTGVDLATWRLKISGQVEKPLSLSMADLERQFPAASVTAVNQCSGNSRGYFSPRIFGGQWAHGAMGNAEWTGARLRDLLAAAGVKQGAVDVTFQGLDRPPLPSVAQFAKSLNAARAMQDPDVIVAYRMNGQALPMLNGFPARLVVPGWYATYWVKNLSEINVLDHEFDGYWMRRAYLIPDNDCGCIEPGTTPGRTVPITRMNVRSFITSPGDGAQVRAGTTAAIRGIAFDGGAGIESVIVSFDAGRTWRRATLGRDLGKYSFREWSYSWTRPVAGRYRVMVRAVNRKGESQPGAALWSPNGYLRNVVEQIAVTVA